MLARKILLSAAMILTVGVIACSPQGREVPLEESGCSLSGVVKYDGKVVSNAMVIVVRTGPGATGTQGFTDDDGNYNIDNVPLGTVKIGVNTDAAKGRMMGRAMAATNPTEKDGKKLVLEKTTSVPKKYFDPNTSDITTEIKPGKNTFNIEISK